MEISSQSDQIVAELERRFPRRIAPYGAWSLVADHLGVTRERVRQVAAAHGYSQSRDITFAEAARG